MNKKQRLSYQSSFFSLQFLKSLHQLLSLFVGVSSAGNCQMLISNFSIIVKFTILHLLKGHCRKINNSISSLIFAFQAVFEFFMEIWHGLSHGGSIDPSWMHSNKLSMTGVHFGKLLSQTNLLSLVSRVLCCSIEFVVIHVKIINDELLGQHSSRAYCDNSWFFVEQR